MIPTGCPYKDITATPCYRCPLYVHDMGECGLATALTASDTHTTQQNAISFAQTYEERLRAYEKQREELLRLFKESLVDLIIHRPEIC